MTENVEGLEARVVRVETNVAYLVAQNTEIKTELRAVNDRIDMLRDKFDERFDKIDEKFEARFDKVDERFDKIDEKFDKIDERFVEVIEKIGDLKVWVIIVIGGGVLSIVARALHWI